MHSPRWRFGRAAALVGVSQPTLSGQLHKAEAELGVTVFDRQSRPIEPTEVGRLVLEHARVVVDAHENLLRLAAGQFAAPDALRLGSSCGELRHSITRYRIRGEVREARPSFRATPTKAC